MSEQAGESTTQKASPRAGLKLGLSGKLLLLTVLFVMLSEVLIYVPSIANFRMTWLRDRVKTAELAAIVIESTPPGKAIPETLRDEMLAMIGAKAVAIRIAGMRRLLAMSDMPPPVGHHVDLRQNGVWRSIIDAFSTLLHGKDRIIRIVAPPPRGGDFLEMVLAEAPLRRAMLRYSVNILVLSLVISMITATLVYLSLNWLLVRPMRRITAAMDRFSEAPEDASRVITPSNRHDEIGIAERRLAEMQRQLTGTLKQQRRLADLGLAVSKINHDLRNMLASAQLFSDRISALPDPTVQRFAPKLIATLDRAIAFCRSTLAYGSVREAPPERRLLNVARLVSEVADVLGLKDHPRIGLDLRIPGDLEIDADPDQLFRVLLNLSRNAVQALEGTDEPSLVRRLTILAERQGSVVRIRVTDTGPGVPARARENLFQAFQGSVRPGGTGLGLAIAAELVRAHGGEIRLREEGPGACFEITIPDRPVELEHVRRDLGAAR